MCIFLYFTFFSLSLFFSYHIPSLVQQCDKYILKYCHVLIQVVFSLVVVWLLSRVWLLQPLGL